MDNEESRHAIKVLRHKIGDEIKIIDGKGSFYTCIITEDNQKKCSFRIKEIQCSPKRPFYIHIAIAPTKNIDRIEWFVEKAVEIGIDEISFINCKNSERKVIKTDRIIRKAISAMKQSMKASLPIINEIISFNQFVKNVEQQNKLMAYVDFDNPKNLQSTASKNSSYCILIGPEGDFSKSELELSITTGFEKVSLGHSRLRTETAGIVACHTLNLINEE